MSSGRDAAPSVVFAGALYPPVNKTLLYVESIIQHYQMFMITIIFIFIHFPLLVFAVELYPPKKQESIIILIVFAVAVITMIIAIFTLLVFAVRYIHLWKTKKKTKERGREGGQGRKER